MIYTEKEFANCVFNPLSKGKMIKNYPKLNEILDSEDKTQNYIDRLIRYTIALYDSQSPLVYQEKELKFRKQAAAELAGFHEEVDVDVLNKIYECKDERAVKISLLYLKKFIKSRVWAMIVSAEQAFWNATDKLMIQVTEGRNETLALLEIQDRTHDRLSKLYIEFYGEDMDLMKVDKDFHITPEKLAKMKKDV